MSNSTIKLPQTIEGVIEQLDIILKDSIASGSRMGYFTALYKRVTVAVKTKIDEGFFDDNPRMERLDVIFANRYLLAYHHYKSGDACSMSWETAFNATSWWSPLVIQHLFVGMNAHISLDLGLAASETEPNDIESLHNDFNKINDVLGSLVDEVESEIASIFWPLKPIDWILGNADEKIAKFGMGIARDAAWKVAVDYSAINNEREREEYLKARDSKVAKFGKKLVQPGRFISFLIRLFRGLEYGRVSYKIGVLNR